MKLGLMQPYFFPYLDYFSLIKYCDKFIFFDTAQYIRRGWYNRNRILKQDSSPNYFTVHIKKAHRETPINPKSSGLQLIRQSFWRNELLRLREVRCFRRKA